MVLKIEKYKIFLFDCDGVLLDSNDIKVNAFYEAVKHHSKSGARELAAYHKTTGGIGRFIKFRYFFENIMKRTDDYTEDYNEALENFSRASYSELLSCQFTKGMEAFLNKLPPNTQKYVISGTEQNELQKILQERDLSKYFNGIFGTPASKDEIFADILKKKENNDDVIYFGDAQKDYEVAMEFNTDFVFVSGYTAFSDWKSFLAEKGVKIVKDFAEI